MFKLPDTPEGKHLGTDVCEEMEIMVFGDEGVCGDSSAIMQYRRWVIFTVLRQGPKDVSCPRLKRSRRPAYRSDGLWVCCRLAEGTSPFVK